MRKMIVAMLLIAFVSGSQLFAENKKIKEEATWKGQIANTLKADLPKGNVITDQATFTKIWGKWAKGQAEPKVDFSKYLIYVHTCDANDRNRQRANFIVKDGTLRAMVMSTRMGFRPDGQNSKYVMYKIPRGGIKNIESFDRTNGRPKKVVTPIAKPKAE